jgi:DNA-binding IclR family transcriptional regulator
MEDRSQYILSSLDNALSILNLFFDHGELTAAEAAQELGISRTAAYRMLVTMEARGYLARSRGSSYRLGVKIFSLGQLAQQRMVLTDLIHPSLAELAERTGETAHLIVMDGAYNVVFIDKVLGNLNLKMDTVLGLRLWAHQTAGGKAMLAWREERFLQEYIRKADFRKITPNTIGSGEELEQELRQIRKRGWARDNEETEIGLTCFAVPICAGGSQPTAAISCSGPTTRMDANRDMRLRALRAAAKEIETRIGADSGAG